MKKLFLLALVLVSLSCNAQKVLSGSFELPAGEKYFYLDWDCSQTLFESKFNEKEWRAIHGDDWEKAKKEVIEMIMRDLNNSMGKISIIAVLPGSELKGTCTLFVCPQKLDRKGNNKSVYILKDANGTELGKAEFKGSGGHWGSFANLIGDGYENAGSKLASLFKKYNKKKR